MGLLRDRLVKREVKRGEDVLRFSSLGKPDRQQWYAANKPEVAEKMNGKQLVKFMYGDLIELLMLFLAKESGHDVQDCQKTVECDGVKGSMDAVIDGLLVDVKSASSYSFDKFKSGGFKMDDPFGYVAQLSGYANADGHDKAAFLVCDKVSGEITLADIDEYDIGAHQPKPRIEHLRSVVNNPEPPKRCYEPVAEGKSGNMKLPIGCSYCPYKFDCHKDANGGKGLRVFTYARGPIFLTHVAKEPRVDES